MTLEELRAAKTALENDLRDILSQRCVEFSKSTGCPVASVSVTICGYQYLGERVGESRVAQVDLRVDTGL